MNNHLQPVLTFLCDKAEALREQGSAKRTLLLELINKTFGDCQSLLNKYCDYILDEIEDDCFVEAHLTQEGIEHLIASFGKSFSDGESFSAIQQFQRTVLSFQLTPDGEDEDSYTIEEARQEIQDSLELFSSEEQRKAFYDRLGRYRERVLQMQQSVRRILDMVKPYLKGPALQLTIDKPDEHGIKFQMLVIFIDSVGILGEELPVWISLIDEYCSSHEPIKSSHMESILLLNYLGDHGLFPAYKKDGNLAAYERFIGSIINLKDEKNVKKSENRADEIRNAKPVQLGGLSRKTKTAYWHNLLNIMNLCISIGLKEVADSIQKRMLEIEPYLIDPKQ